MEMKIAGEQGFLHRNGRDCRGRGRAGTGDGPNNNVRGAYSCRIMLLVVEYFFAPLPRREHPYIFRLKGSI